MGFMTNPTTGVRFLWVCLLLICAAGCTALILKPEVGLGTIGIGVGLPLLSYVVAATVGGRIEPLILSWMLIFPLGYYFLSFPAEKSVVTLDRVLPMALLLAMALAPNESSEPIPVCIRKCALAWGMFLMFAGVSVLRASDALIACRRLVDSFCLPAIVGWAVIRNLRVRSHLSSLHTVASMMAVYVACIGAGEMILLKDLLPLPASTIYLAGALPRPNGPFYSNDSFALIGLITLFLLVFLRKVMGEEVSFWRKTVHAFGVTASLAMALMPLFRSVLITLIFILLLGTLAVRKPSRKIAGFAFLFFCLVAISVVGVLAPEVYEDRVRPDNFYARLAEQIQTIQVFLSHPVLGVGLTNFTKVVKENTQFSAYYEGVQSINSPHNNLGGILSETGVVGFIPYIVSQVLLISAFWKARKRGAPGAEAVWTYFLYIFLSYWVNGMTLASGYNSDLNLWFILAVATLYKYSIEDDVSREPAVAGHFAQEYEYV
jgi:hypothetical protein